MVALASDLRFGKRAGESFGQNNGRRRQGGRRGVPDTTAETMMVVLSGRNVRRRARLGTSIGQTERVRVAEQGQQRRIAAQHAHAIG